MAKNKSSQPLDRNAIKTRFQANMARIAAIVSHLNSETGGLNQIKFGENHPVRADILRAVVVFLHATFEDSIRSQFPKPNKKFTFYSNSDIKRALVQLKLDPALFSSLFPPLTQMAKRRNRIVHYADLPEANGERVKPWDFVDEWLMLQWNITVVTFYYRLLKATGPINAVEQRMLENNESALVQNVELAHAFIEFPNLSPEQLRDGLIKLGERVQKMLDTLKLDTKMFLAPDGQPLEGVIESFKREENDSG